MSFDLSEAERLSVEVFREAAIVCLCQEPAISTASLIKAAVACLPEGFEPANPERWMLNHATTGSLIIDRCLGPFDPNGIKEALGHLVRANTVLSG